MAQKREKTKTAYDCLEESVKGKIFKYPLTGQIGEITHINLRGYQGTCTLDFKLINSGETIQLSVNRSDFLEDLPRSSPRIHSGGDN